MKALAIAAVNLRRTLRERTSLFFIVLFPMLLILVLGMAFGGTFEPRVGIVAQAGEPLAGDLVERLRAAEGIDVRLLADEEQLITAVERGDLEAGLVVPAGYDKAVAGQDRVTVRYVVRPGVQGQQVGSVVTAVVDEEAGRLRAARVAGAEAGLPFDAALGRVDGVAASAPAVSVAVRTAGEAEFPEGLGRFDVMASSQLLLFIFLTSLTGASALIETRRLGVARRMLATPVTAGTVILGEALGRFAVAVLQGVVIMGGSALIFGVDWGTPVAAVLLMVAFALFASGAGLLTGAVARTSEQAVAVGVLLGMAFGALGGAMMPLDLFSRTMRTVAHLTPHAWAVDGYAELVRRGGGLLDVLPQIGVLAAGAAVLLGVASWRLRRVLTN
jgi:ABC-2 type transport system permease protein